LDDFGQEGRSLLAEGVSLLDDFGQEGTSLLAVFGQEGTSLLAVFCFFRCRA